MTHSQSAFGAAPSRGRHQRPGSASTTVTAWLRISGLVGAALSMTALGGCSAMRMPEPWVKPFERERLADPVMKSLRDPMAAKHREHVLIVREGARGANGVQGGGCGCN